MKKNAYLCHRIQLFVDKLNYTTMKKVYLMKGIAVMALGLTIASCSKDVFDPNALQAENEEAFNNNFQTNVLNGQEIDPDQTWSTAEQATVTVSVNLDYGEEYTVYVLAENPNYNSTANYLGVEKIKSGNKATITIAKPSDLTALYLACVDKKGNYFVERFEIEGSTASVNIGKSSSQNAVARRAASTVNGVSVNPDDYKRAKTEFINNLQDYNNNWASYYDMSLVDPDKSLNNIAYTQENNYQGGPVYGDNKHFILPAGKNFTLTSTNLSNAWSDMVIVVKGTLTIPAQSECRLYGSDGTYGQTIVIDGGTVICNATKLTFANKSNIINLGGNLVLNSTLVDYANGADKGFCNFGSIIGTRGAGFNFAGGSPYYNAGSIDLTDKGFIKFNGNISFTNAGHIHAYNSDESATTVYDSELARGAQNATVYNLCDMTFTKFFGVNKYVGTNNSFLYAQEGLCTNYGASITLGSQAMVKVGDWYHNGGGCYASSNADDYAVMVVTGSLDEQNGGACSETAGYFYFDIDESQLLGKGINGGEGLWHINQVKEKMLIKTVSEATAPSNITIASEEKGCNYIGYHEGGGGSSFTPSYVYYAFEDLGTTDDFDFNDVVLRVSARNAQGNCSVDLVAAGGTMSTTVKYDGTQLGSEVHTAFNAGSTKTMVNTDATDGVSRSFVNLGTINVAANADLTNLPLGISCQSGGSVINVTRTGISQNHGQAPLVIVVSGNSAGKWFWAKERVNISTAYTSFGTWGANAASNADWYKNATSDQVHTW